MSPASDLRDYLVAQGASTVGTTFSGEMPPTPDELTVLRDTPGYPSQFFMGVNLPGVEYPGVQVSFRATTKVAAETRAWAAHRVLSALTHAVINTRRYEEARPQQCPFLLNRDPTGITAGGSDGRAVYAFNVLVMRDVT